MFSFLKWDQCSRLTRMIEGLNIIALYETLYKLRLYTTVTYLLYHLCFNIFKASIFFPLKSYYLRRLRRKESLKGQREEEERESKQVCCDNENENKMTKLRKFFGISSYSLYVMITDCTVLLLFFLLCKTMEGFTFVW